MKIKGLYVPTKPIAGTKQYKRADIDDVKAALAPYGLTVVGLRFPLPDVPETLLEALERLQRDWEAAAAVSGKFGAISLEQCAAELSAELNRNRG